ncbi:MAG: tRNA 2-thiouridine(34) synthase MnmA [Candidatus Aminicenantes bacterium]|nr:MAG: tRNA 2-thiouridine(34) synthase MnmA [Candidatus Aminicenantes bacterium]
MKRKKVVIAMSGGVDSSLAAAILKEGSYDVIGVTMKLFSLPDEYCRSENLRSCCGWKAVEDANRVATSIGIPHYVVDFKKIFEKNVITDFCEEYSRGRTPNPCIRCNEYIKFDALQNKAKALNADYLATGHHARVDYDPELKRFLLRKGKDREKDQSYFLYPLTQDQLSRTLMPIGHFTKKEVREKAKGLGIPVAQRPESQEICFVPDNDYAGFLEKRIPEAFGPGPILDIGNRVIGKHKGIAHFTIGQRRGMGISAPHPLYVIAIRSDENAIVVGKDEHLYEKTLLASRINLISKEKLGESLKVKARIRYKHREGKATLTPVDTDQVLVEFEKPQRAITPGQAVVFYDKDVVVGGGLIERIREEE